MKLKIIPKVKKEKEKLHKQKSNSSLSGKKITTDVASALQTKTCYGRMQKVVLPFLFLCFCFVFCKNILWVSALGKQNLR